jgi:hypothetical protein
MARGIGALAPEGTTSGQPDDPALWGPGADRTATLGRAGPSYRRTRVVGGTSRWTDMRLLRMVVVAALFAAACGDLEVASPTGRPRPLPPPAGEVRSELVDEDHVRQWPASGTVEQGVPYRMTTHTQARPRAGLRRQLLGRRGQP